MDMDVFEKLTILADAAKYDAACTSSGSNRKNGSYQMGNAIACGICHSFASDGRCISLLKVLLSNDCAYDCAYCVNRHSHDTPRASFSPRELADLTMHFYRRNYIEGLFLSSGVLKNPDYTCEQMIKTLRILREEYRFGGYIHAKAIPGVDEKLITVLGQLCDRISVNIEFPSQKSLQLFAPQKSKKSILKPMNFICQSVKENSRDLVRYRHAPTFAPAGQSTQMMIGASGESDYQILRLADSLYQKYSLKRVFYSAYVPVVQNPMLPSRDVPPPLLRENRLYQADWLLRFYGFSSQEILDEDHPNFNPYIDPKCNWALNHMDWFPVEINRAPYEMLLRVPGIGVKSAKRIVAARKTGSLRFEDLKKIGVVIKRAQFFITCQGRMKAGVRFSPEAAYAFLVSQKSQDRLYGSCYEQLSLWQGKIGREEVNACLTAPM